MTKEVVVITGASSGFGLCIALEFAKENYDVIATMRDANKEAQLMEEARKLGVESNITILIVDVTDEVSIDELTEYVKQKGRVDILINNAGFASAGFVEEIPIHEYKQQFETNFFGTILLTQKILPIMREREQCHGKIIMMSSISGQVGFPGLSPYVSSKFALEGWSESLRLELLPFSIYVSIIEPGSFRTNIWSSGKKITEKSLLPDSPYRKQMVSLEKYLQSSSQNYGDPIQVAKKLVTISKNNSPKLRYTVGKGVRETVILKKIFPWRWWEKVVLSVLKK